MEKSFYLEIIVMFEILLSAELMCHDLVNYMITSRGDCIDLSPLIEGRSPSEFNRPSSTSGSSEDFPYNDNSVSTTLRTKTPFSYFVVVSNNQSSGRIIPTYISYELLDANSTPFHTDFYSIPPVYADVGIAPGGSRSIRVEFSDRTRSQNRGNLSDYKVRILSVGYNQSRFR